MDGAFPIIIFFLFCISIVSIAIYQQRLKDIYGDMNSLIFIDMIVYFLKSNSEKIKEVELQVVKKIIENELKPPNTEKVYARFYRSLHKPKKDLQRLIDEAYGYFDKKGRARILLLLLYVIYADNLATKNEKELLRKIAKKLNINQLIFNAIFNSFIEKNYKGHENQYSSYQSKQSNKENYQRVSTPQSSSISSAYRILGISSNATEKEIKSAYRKLAKIYHPDKNQTKSNLLIQKSKEHFIQLNKAFEQIKKARGIK